MNWNDVLRLTKENPAPPRRVEKTKEEWKRVLTPEQFNVTRLHGTERPFSGEYCELYAAGVYLCLCCGTELFDSTGKFKSGTGWPSFSEPVKDNVIRYIMDNSYGMQRVEVLCNVCDAHLGHVFPDGPPPSDLRFCINSISLEKAEAVIKEEDIREVATLGNGCFWCTEAVLDELDGVDTVVSGYAGGDKDNPTYYQVSDGDTGHAEVVQVTFNPGKISYADILRVFFATHDPTSLNRQGADVGTQYRSIILYHNEAQLQTAKEIMKELQSYYDKPIVTEIVPFEKFYKAEQGHQEYYRNNPEAAYCQLVINPKLQKLRSQFASSLKKKANAL
ncbi:MAG TPA: bifunctional methionine sulfoxide reductase B/A protein [Chitinophagaceae bacterium]|jgi:peptide methionine sulfoxide reductase msrA/msrB|nr:bifunctional methionine sulfoxide reductase B/A protein [Chitinophagaceae bacterium]